MNINGAKNQITDIESTVQTNSKTVINAKGMSVASAREKLQAIGFNVVSKVEDENVSIVTDQMPKPGAYLEAGATIYLYTSNDEVRTSVTVPDLKNKSLSEAVEELKSLNLNVTVDGEKRSSYTSKYYSRNRSRRRNCY